VLLGATPVIDLRAAEPPVVDAEVAKGIAEVDNGEYDAAILTLDAAARRLTSQLDRRSDLVQAYVYLAVAYLAKGHETAARSRFRDALALDRALRLEAEKFSPRVVDLFEQARDATSAVPPPSPAASVPPPPSAKRGSKGLGTLLQQTFAGLTPGSNQFFDVTVRASGTLQVTLDWTTTGHDLDVYLSTPACTSTDHYPPDVCTIVGRAESPTSKPEVLQVPVTPGVYRIAVWWCGDAPCGTGTESGTVRAVLRGP
jgi:hypothetical protein